MRTQIRRVVDLFTPFLSKLLALAIILFASFRLYATAATPGGLQWYDICGAVLIYICSLLIIVDSSFGLNRAIGFYAFAIGGNRFILSLHYLLDPSPIIFLIGAVLAGMSVNLCYTGFCFVKGSTRKRMSMFFTITAMFLVHLTMIAFYIEFFGMTYGEVIADQPDTIAQLFMYLLLLGCLTTEEVRNSSREEQINTIIQDIRLTNAYFEESYIGPKAARILCSAFEDRSAWRDRTGHGPVECEYICHLIHGKHDFSFVRLQKWKGDDSIYITVTGNKTGSVIDAFRFRAVKIVPDGSIDDCTSITVYGEGVQMLRFNVHRRPEQ